MNRVEAFSVLPGLREKYNLEQGNNTNQDEERCVCNKRHAIRLLQNLDVNSFQPIGCDELTFNLTWNDLTLLFEYLFSHPLYSNTPFTAMITGFFTLEEIRPVIVEVLNINCCDRHRQKIRQASLNTISNYGLVDIDVSTYGIEPPEVLEGYF